jgi:hypothetical protein
MGLDGNRVTVAGLPVGVIAIPGGTAEPLIDHV